MFSMRYALMANLLFLAIDSRAAEYWHFTRRPLPQIRAGRLFKPGRPRMVAICLHIAKELRLVVTNAEHSTSGIGGNTGELTR